ncbi:MAG: threonylcarbamoyladenosine tRNA methylthiotransferase [Candidatus Nealsonbacteria bacterium]|nr:MAG: threonylcarbamoyladenosine tRNA methylthiotransferase [Candidatus Nealsonbacteria bacterium]
MPLISPKLSLSIVDGAVAARAISKVSKIAERILKGEEKVFCLKPLQIDKAKERVKNFSSLCLMKKLQNSVSEQVSISEGCLGNCSYCTSKFARGKLKSFYPTYILKEINQLLEYGFKEIQLTAQDTAVYGLDKNGPKLPQLLEEISKIPADFKIRVGMMNPKFAKLIYKDLISVFHSNKIYKYLHLPVQSGDNKILEKMKRGYRVEDFEKIVYEFKKEFDDLLLATDIIVGFPGEDEKSFQKTVKLIERVRPHIINITKFSPRPGTEAKNWQQLPQTLKNERTKILREISQDIRKEDNQKFLGKVFEVLITEKRKNETLLSRTNSFKAVILKEGKIGEKQKVKITDYKINYLIGKILN